MPFIELRFNNGEVIRLPEGTPQPFIEALQSAHTRFGGMTGVNQWMQFDALKSDQNFLSLPRTERTRIFNDMANKSPEFWQTMDPGERHLFRRHIAEAEGANQQDAYNYWEAPIQFRDQQQSQSDSLIEEFSNALSRSAPKTWGHIAAGLTNILAETSRVVGQAMAVPGSYTAGKAQPWLDEIQAKMQDVAQSASIGAETLAPAPKIDEFGKVHGWDDFTMYMAQALGQQVPVLGSMILAGAPTGGVGSFVAGAALESGSIQEDLIREGFDPAEANKTAALYGVMAGALEGMPIANFIRRTPGLSKGFRSWVTGTLKNMGTQAIEEAGTEGLQTVVERSAADYLHAMQGDLEKISWATPEGRKNLWDEAREAMIQGGLIGGLLGGGGGGARTAMAQRGQEAAAPELTPDQPAAGASPASSPLPPPGVTPGPAAPEETFTTIPPEAPAPAGPLEGAEPTEEELARSAANMGLPPGPQMQPLTGERLPERPAQDAAILQRRQSEAEDWFAPLPADAGGSGWVLLNPGQGAAAEDLEQDRAVFVEEIRDSQAIVRDQDGNLESVPVLDAEGNPNLYAPTKEDGFEYLRKLSAMKSEGGLDILTATDLDGVDRGFAFNEAGYDRQTQREAIEAENAPNLQAEIEENEREKTIIDKVFAGKPKINMYEKVAPVGGGERVWRRIDALEGLPQAMKRDNRKDLDQIKSEKIKRAERKVAAIQSRLAKERDPEKQAALKVTLQKAQESLENAAKSYVSAGLPWDEAGRLIARELGRDRGPGPEQNMTREEVVAFLSRKRSTPAATKAEIPAPGFLYGGRRWEPGQAPAPQAQAQPEAAQAATEPSPEMSAAQLEAQFPIDEERDAVQGDMEDVPFQAFKQEGPGLFDEQEARTQQQGRQAPAGEAVSPLFGGPQEAAEGKPRTRDERIAELKGWIKELEAIKEPSSGQKAALADNYRQLRMLERGLEPAKKATAKPEAPLAPEQEDEARPESRTFNVSVDGKNVTVFKNPTDADLDAIEAVNAAEQEEAWRIMSMTDPQEARLQRRERAQLKSSNVKYIGARWAYDAEGNEYAWIALGGIHEDFLPAIKRAGASAVISSDVRLSRKEAQERLKGSKIARPEARPVDPEKRAEQRASDQGTRKADFDDVYGPGDQGTLFQATASQVVKKIVDRYDLSEVRRALRGWAVEKTDRGWKLSLPGWPDVEVVVFPDLMDYKTGGDQALWDRTVENLWRSHFSEEMELEELKTMVRAGHYGVAGYFKRIDKVSGGHIIALSGAKMKSTTLFHESFHFAFHSVLNPGQRQAILDTFGSEEKAAEEYAKLLEAKFKVEQGKELNEAQKALLWLWDWAKRFVQAFIQPDLAIAHSTFEKIQSGEIWMDQEYLGTAMQSSLDDPLGIERTWFAEGGPGKFSSFRLAEEITDAATFDAQVESNLSQEGTERALRKAWREQTDRENLSEDTELFQPDLGAPPVRISHPDALYQASVQGDSEHQDAGVVLARQTIKEWFREKVMRQLFDKLEPIQKLQEVLTKEGKKIHDGLDAYLKARNFSARAGALTGWVQRELFQPFIDKIAEMKIDLRTFDEFRMAVGALESNPTIFRMHVVVPRAALKKWLDQMTKLGVRKGMVVRVPDLDGVSGKVVKVTGEGDARKVQIEYLDQARGETRLVEYEYRDVMRDSEAEIRERLKKIDDMVAAGDDPEKGVPHSGVPSSAAREMLREMRDLGLIKFDGEPNNQTQYSGKLWELSKLFDKVIRWKEQTLVDSGLLSKEELDRWRKDHPRFYCPMRGDGTDILDAILGGDRPPIPEIEAYGGKMWYRAVDTAAKAMGYRGEIHRPNVGRGYNPGARAAARRRLGRHDLPTHSPTVELFTDALEVAIRSEKNRVAQTVWNLFKSLSHLVDRDGKPLFIFDEPPEKRYFDKKTNTVKTKPDTMALSKPNVYDIWIDGEHHYVRSVDPSLSGVYSALNNMGPEAAPRVLRMFSHIVRYISKMATGRNPAFAIPNLVRDLITAGIRMRTDMEDLQVDLLKSIPRIIKMLAVHARNPDKLTAEQRRRIEKWKAAGGETAYWLVPNLQTQMKHLQRDIERAAKNDFRVFRWVRLTCDFLEDYNGALEGAVRFAVFEKALEKGYSLDKAALASREITVDFTRQGTWAGWMGSLYAFANASLQGSRMVYNTLKTPTGQKWFAGLMALGMTQALTNSWAGGEDEDDERKYWDKLTPYEKSRNLVLMVPGGDGLRLKIPMPWGFNVPFMMGTMMMDAARGLVAKDKGAPTPWEAAGNIVSSAFGAFNPIGDVSVNDTVGWLQLVAPTWADPIVDIGFNRTFWGGPIMPEDTSFKRSERYGMPKKDHLRFFDSASRGSRATTKLLYEMTGISVSPESVDYSVSAVFGGLGDAVNKTISMPFNFAQRGKLSLHEVPVVRSFLAGDSQYYASQVYRESMADHWYKWEQWNELKKENGEQAGAYYQRWAHTLGLHDTVLDYEKRVAALRKADVRTSDPRIQKLYKQFTLLYDRSEANARRKRKQQASIMAN